MTRFDTYVSLPRNVRVGITAGDESLNLTIMRINLPELKEMIDNMRDMYDYQAKIEIGG